MLKGTVKMLKRAVMGASIWSTWDTELPAFVISLIKLFTFWKKNSKERQAPAGRENKD